MKIAIPELSLVALIGVSGSGKSTFAARHFLPTEVLSSDGFRAMLHDDPNDQTATEAAFETLHYVAGKRLAAGRLTVVDATNVQQQARKQIVELARAHHVLPVAIVLDVPEALARERNSSRPDRDFGAHVIRQQRQQLRRGIKGLQREGFRRVFTLRSPEEIDAAEVIREKGWSDLRDEHGPFDLVGDVHGCFDELVELLAKLGYTAGDDGLPSVHPEGRKAVFLGDLVDRGPKVPDVLRLAMAMVARGSALCVPGNHEDKLVRALRGRNVQVTHGLGESLAQLEAEPEEFRTRAIDFLDGLVSHLVLDGGALVAAHAGMREDMQGRASAAVRAFALYGETTGETDEFGLPVRYPWARDYRGKAAVVYGHTPVPEPEWVNNTINVDTGCVFGGRLTALRWPERELVSVPAARTYYEPAKPFLAPEDQAPAVDTERDADFLDIGDVLGKRIVETRLSRTVTVREENAAAALEVMSRFAADPRWLIYLPPTMSPVATSKREGILEHPEDAFSFYRHEGVGRVVCEEKHMGSRAVAIVCRDGDAAPKRFGIEGDGIVYTRTGRPFFESAMEGEVLARLREAVAGSGLWDELESDWVALDCELLPWSAKAEELLRRQYAAVGASGRAASAAAAETIALATARGIDVGTLLEAATGRGEDVAGFVEAYRRYVWPVASADDLRLAPFQVLAAEGRVFTDRDHGWHMEINARLSGASSFVQPTRWLEVDVTDSESEAAAIDWWTEMTEAGGEGMVVKPAAAIVRGRKGVVQPALKVRGREYLRLIYGPEYTREANLSRLRERGLGHKRSLALREFGLGIEALERWARREPLYRVHECVFGVLALESEPVDPRL